MEHEVITYLTPHVTLTKEMKQIIREVIIVRQYTKGTLLLKAGEYARESFLILKGSVRSYTVQDDVEKTLEFYTEYQPVVPLAYGSQQPSGEYLECMEDTLASVSSAKYEEEMFARYPEFEKICRLMGEVMMATQQEKFTRYKLSTPEERYQYLLEHRSDLLQRAPQYQLASYLGVTPESLSRIRRRLQKKAND